jgi:hypothetical protein
MNAISRSWNITKLTFTVIGQDKEMLLFPFFASIASILYVAAILVPSGLLQALSESDAAGAEAVWGVTEYTILFVVYLGLSFIATFFNVCVVYTTKTRFEGGDATFMDSIRFGMSKTVIIFQWSLLAATVGLLLAMLERFALRLGGIGKIVVNLIRSVLGLAWSVLTLFVVPVLVYENVSPLEAVRRSKDILDPICLYPCCYRSNPRIRNTGTSRAGRSCSHGAWIDLLAGRFSGFQCCQYYFQYGTLCLR